MKVTSSFFYQTFFNELNKQIEAMYKAQRQLATGKRVLLPSDDPIAISRITKYKAELYAFEEYSRVIDTAKIYNSSIESAIDDLKRMIIKAKQIAVQGSTDTLSPTDRLALSREVDTLIQRSIDTINTKVSNRYIFAGYKADIPPVDKSTGAYQSDMNLQNVDINIFLDVAINLPASEFFTYTALASNQVFTPYNQNPTGELHDVDPLSALLMSQPQPSGSPSPIINPDASFTNGGTLSLRLGDMQLVSVTISAGSSLNDVKDAINNQAGSYVKAWVVNVGTTGNPDYRIVINSVPNGKSDQIRITVNTNDEADTGLNLLYYDPVSPSSEMTLRENIDGYNYITEPNDPNFYSFNNNYLNGNYYLRALYFLKVSLENNDQGRIQKAVKYIDQVADKLFRQQSIIGARLNKIETIRNYNLVLETNTRQNLSNDQDADVAKIISELNQRAAVLQALRITFTDFLRRNLFDFLR